MSILIFTALISGGTAISGSATQHVFFVNNNGGPVTITLPPANVVGKFIRIMGTQAPGVNIITLNTATHASSTWSPV